MKPEYYRESETCMDCKYIGYLGPCKAYCTLHAFDFSIISDTFDHVCDDFEKGNEEGGK